MFAVKGNIEYSITENDKKQYIEAGYDIYDENGKKISEGANKKVSAEVYDKLKKEYDKVNKTVKEKDAEIAELNKKLAEKEDEIKKANDNSKKEKTDENNKK